MRRSLFSVTTAVFLLCVACRPGTFFFRCLENGQIDTAQRAQIEEDSLRFVKAAFAGQVDSAYSQFTGELSQATTRQQFLDLVRTLQSYGPLEDFRVQRTCLVKLTGLSSMPQQHILCAQDLSRPERRVTLVVKPVREQAYVLVEGRAKGETWVATLWLIPEKGEWRVQNFHATIATALGRPTDAVLSQAREEKAHGHFRNAALLYAGAATLAFRGPVFQWGVQQAIYEEMQALSLPEDVKGQAPFVWQSGQTSFKILRISPLVDRGKLYLAIAHEVHPWLNDAEVDHRNLQLVDYVLQHFPEYSHIAAGLVIEGHEAGRNHWHRTVEEYEKLMPKPSSRYGKTSGKQF